MSIADEIQAFFDDIIAHPHDDAPRLILADWIEENAERLPAEQAASLRARGELIRVQFALEEMHPGNPRRPGLIALQNALLQKHLAEWTSPHAFLSQQKLTFRRGFIEHTMMDPETIHEYGDQLRQAIPLRSLAVGIGWTPAIRSILAAEHPLLEQVEELELSAGIITKEEEARGWMNSSRLGRLRRLSLSDNPILVFALIASRLTTRLRHLEIGFRSWSLDYGEWPPLPSGEIRYSFLSLESLTVSAEWFRDQRRTELLASLALPALSRFVIRSGSPSLRPTFAGVSGLLSRVREIDLSGMNSLGAIEFLEALPATLALESLSLTRCKLEAAHVRRLGQLTEVYPALWSLNLATNRLGDTGARVLATSPLLREVRSLNLSYNRIGGEMADLLAALPSGLVSLDLSWNNPGGALDALSHSAAAATLQALTASYCSLTGEAAQALADLPAGILHSLNLGSNRLTTASARILIHSPALSSLEALDLSNNNLDDDFADGLLDSPLVNSLRLLVVFGNRISSQAMGRLRAGFRGIVG